MSHDTATRAVKPAVKPLLPGMRKLLYVAGESGVVSLFNVESAHVTKRGEGLLGPHAHVVAVDPDTHLAYFPLMNLGGHPALRIMRPQPH